MWLEFKLSLVFILPNLIAYPSNIGKIVKQTDANDHTTTSVYDLHGHLTDSYDALGTSHKTYDKDDRLHTSVDTNGQTTTYSYNDAARSTIIIDPLGVTITKKYDKVGNLIEESDSENRSTKYYYDELNRQTTIKDAVGGITRYTYDNNGKTKSILDADSNLSRLTSENTTLN